MSTPKFSPSDRVTVIDAKNKQKGDSGEVTYFDSYNRSYTVLLEKLGDTRVYRASQLDFESKVSEQPTIILGKDLTEPLDIKAGTKMRWMADANNREWYGAVVIAPADMILGPHLNIYNLEVAEPNNLGNWPGGHSKGSKVTLAIYDLEIEISSSKSKPKVEFESVIVEEDKKEQILEALEQVNQADLIFDVWGFGETIEKGKGVSLLFYGPPGTGKTLMAQAIANKLDRKLVIIATADVESSAPGEAERNIRKHFKDAQKNNSVLLFDECDSLIYNRQHTGPIMGAQVNELLSQLERFEGVTVFTTNRLGTLDEAVNRRLALKLEFDMPNRTQRAKIWERMFPKRAPLDDDVDYDKLASVEITGGYIKNTVLRAARMAAIEKVADTDKKIRMKHLVKALRLETESMLSFEDARAEHRSGADRVGYDENGQRVIRSTKSSVEALHG